MTISCEDGPLTSAQIEQFIEKGFIRIDRAFPSELAEASLPLLWHDTGCHPDDPSSWTQPVIRLGNYAQEPFRLAVNTPVLRGAFDQLVGKGRWLPRESLGSFVVRFPSAIDPDDLGWHIDTSFGTDHKDFMAWRANVYSKGRALLMLFLFSDVDEMDAPTRLRAGSHRAVARRLEPAGEEGLTLRELASTDFAESEDCPTVLATGDAGTVYLCHPFLVHAAQMHHGTRPRFVAQPPLYPAQPLILDGAGDEHSPVELAVRRALQEPFPGAQKPSVNPKPTGIDQENSCRC